MVFDNEVRKIIYNHIATYPGVSFNTLLNIFELTEGGLRYHLDYLTKCDKIYVRLENGRRLLYPRFDPAYISDKYKLNPVQKKLLDEIRFFPAISQKELIFKIQRPKVSCLPVNIYQ